MTAPALRLVPAGGDRSPAGVYLSGLAPTGRRVQEAALAHLAGLLLPGADLRTFPWSALTYAHAIEARARLLAAGAAPRTVNRHLSALRGVAREAFRLGLMDAEQSGRVAAVRSVPVHTLPAGRHVGGGELAELFKVAGPRDCAILAFLFGCGMRRAELCALLLEDVDLEAGEVRIRGAKGRKDRETALPPGALEAVRAWVALRGTAPGPLLQPYQGGVVRAGGITPGTVYDALRRVVRAAKVAGLTPHDLRRTYIGRMLEAGVDVVTVQRMVGHADPRTTAAYDRRGADVRVAAATRLAVPFGGDGPPK